MVVAASQPLETRVENGTRPPQFTSASITAPLWAIAATVPRRTSFGNSADVRHRASHQVGTPMQFGPTIDIWNLSAIPASPSASSLMLPPPSQ